MKLSSMLARLREQLEPVADEADADHWRDDPLAHPSLSRMSQRELGDMPFDRLRGAPDAGGGASCCCA